MVINRWVRPNVASVVGPELILVGLNHIDLVIRLTQHHPSYNIYV